MESLNYTITHTKIVVKPDYVYLSIHVRYIILIIASDFNWNYTRAHEREVCVTSARPAATLVSNARTVLTSLSFTVSRRCMMSPSRLCTAAGFSSQAFIMIPAR